MEQEKRKMTIDRNISEQLRGVAIIAVIAGHILGGKFGIISTHVTSILGIGGVTVFLILSGYGLFSSYQNNGIDTKVYWSKKIHKVFIPYMIVTVVYYVYLRFRNSELDFLVLLDNILCIDFNRHIDGTMWYMSFILIWYILFYVIFYIEYPTIIKIMLVWLFGMAFRNYWLKDLFEDCAWQFYTNALAFPVGATIGFLFQKIRAPKTKYINCVLVLISVFFFVAGNCGFVSLSYPQYGCLLFVILYIVFMILKDNMKSLKIFNIIGKYSFILYLIEGKMIGIVDQIQFSNSNVVIYCFMYIIMTTIIVVVWRFLGEKNILINQKINTNSKKGEIKNGI